MYLDSTQLYLVNTGFFPYTITGNYMSWKAPWTSSSQKAVQSPARSAYQGFADPDMEEAYV